ncbi:hypothetical protein AAMO2058_001472600 [Amorphochlora amoebiformis]
MGRKRKNKKKEVIRRPFCYYCDREFVDEKVLVRHQKAKHFTCNHCFKKLGTVKGLVLHVAKLHKEVLSTLPGCKEGRENLEIVIEGMKGVPDEIIAEHYGIEVEKKQKTEPKPMPVMSTMPGMPMRIPGMPPMGIPGMRMPMPMMYPPNPYMGAHMMPYSPYGVMPPQFMGNSAYPPAHGMPMQHRLPPHTQHPYQVQQKAPPRAPPQASAPPPTPAPAPTPAPTPATSPPPTNGLTVSKESKLVFVFKGEGESMVQ